jgi:hypothetical protein
MSEQETGSRRPDRVHERAADPADTADRPLEPRAQREPLHTTDTPHAQSENPHHRLNTPVGDVDPAADSDPYRAPDPEDEDDRASGITGEGEGSEDR